MTGIFGNIETANTSLMGPGGALSSGLADKYLYITSQGNGTLTPPEQPEYTAGKFIIRLFGFTF